MIQLFTVSRENPSTEQNQFITFYVDGFIGISNHYHTTILHIPNQLSVNCVNAFNCGQHIFIRCKLNTVTIFSGLCLSLQRVNRYSSGIPPVPLWTYLYEACMWGDYSKCVSVCIVLPTYRVRRHRWHPPATSRHHHPFDPLTKSAVRIYRSTIHRFNGARERVRFVSACLLFSSSAVWASNWP